MCDFRLPPIKYKDQKIEYQGSMSVENWQYYRDNPTKVSEVGVYIVCATGSWYSYFDGEREVGPWHYDENGQFCENEDYNNLVFIDEKSSRDAKTNEIIHSLQHISRGGKFGNFNWQLDDNEQDASGDIVYISDYGYIELGTLQGFSKEDKEFIVNAPDNMKYLVEKVVELEAEIETLKK